MASICWNAWNLVLEIPALSLTSGRPSSGKWHLQAMTALKKLLACVCLGQSPVLPASKVSFKG